EVVVDPNAGTHRPTSRAGRIPRQAHARLQERAGIVPNEYRLAHVRLREDEPALVIAVIGAAPVEFIPSRGHLVPQAQAHRKIRAELDFILEIPGGFRGAEVQRNRTRGRLQSAWWALMH